MRRYPRHLNVAFCQGQAGDFSFGRPFDLIVCNGLVGGRFFHRPEQYAGFLASCRKCLAPGGRLFLANRFHEGARRDVEAFMRAAARAGFPMQGTWRLMHGAGLRL